MDFRLDDEQLALQDAVRSWCATRFPLDGLAARDGAPIARDTWRALAELGALGVLVPEADGGAGLGPVEAAIVLEELGHHLAPVPVLWSMLTASLLPAVTDGARVVGGLDATDPAVEPSGPVLVEHAADLDTLVVLRGDGVSVCDRAELGPAATVTPLDPLTPIGRWDALPPGTLLAGPDHVDRLRLLGTVLAAALLVGVSAAGLETARAYALERRQFGVPIGSFQAVKHLLADMYVRTALSRSATYAAAALVDDPAAAPAAAHGAKLLAGEAALANAKAAVQILGGMGFTWAMVPHYLLKRAWVLEHTFGTADAHARALGARLDEEVA
jgi:alkylation response protein AidB-like acyl-CoA dehydrogenase